MNEYPIASLDYQVPVSRLLAVAVPATLYM